LQKIVNSMINIIIFIFILHPTPIFNALIASRIRIFSDILQTYRSYLYRTGESKNSNSQTIVHIRKKYGRTDYIWFVGKWD